MSCTEEVSKNPKRLGSTGQALLLSAAAGYGQVLVALIYILTAREVGPVDFGAQIAAVALATVFAGLFDFGSNMYWVREIARETQSPRSYVIIARTKSSLCLFLILLLAIVSIVGNFAYYETFILVSFALIIGQLSLVPLRGCKRGDLVALCTTFDRTVTIIVFIVLVRSEIPASWTLLVALTIGPLAGAVLAWIFFFKITPRQLRTESWRLFRNPWKGSFHFGMSGIAVSAQSLDVPILSALSGGLAAGLYGAVNRWTQPMGLVVNAYTSATMPFVAKAGSVGDAWPHIKRSSWILIVSLLACIAAALLAPQIVDLLVGPEFAGSAAVLRILAIGTIPAILNQPLMGFLQALGADRATSRTMIVSIMIFISMLFLVVGEYGAIGAAFSFALYQGIIFIILMTIFVRKILGES